MSIALAYHSAPENLRKLNGLGFAKHRKYFVKLRRGFHAFPRFLIKLMDIFLSRKKVALMQEGPAVYFLFFCKYIAKTAWKTAQRTFMHCHSRVKIMTPVHWDGGFFLEEHFYVNEPLFSKFIFLDFMLEFSRNKP